MQHLVVLGRTHELCFLEWTQVVSVRFPNAITTILSPTLLQVEGITDEEMHVLQDTLGGVIKIAKIFFSSEKESDARLQEIVTSHLLTRQTDNRLTFALGSVGPTALPFTEHDIKGALKDKDIVSRYVQGEKTGLSASVLLHQGVSEILLYADKEQMILAETIAIQDIDNWTVRDRKKPAADPKHGMLPPKVARMMINIAVQGQVEGKRILDPFCGTGTVVLEALVLGAEGLGSDIRLDAINAATKNTAWLKQIYPEQVKKEPILFLSDATAISLNETKGPIDAIVAEGYLGPMNFKKGNAANIFKGLEKMYKGSFKQWREVLRPGRRVCLALPRAQVEGKQYDLSRLVDDLASFGYNRISGSVIYDRPGATVAREIVTLEYKG